MRRSTSASAFRFSSSELNRVVDRTSTASASRVPSCVEPPAASCGGAASVGSPDTLSAGKRLRAVSSLYLDELLEQLGQVLDGADPRVGLGRPASRTRTRATRLVGPGGLRN